MGRNLPRLDQKMSEYEHFSPSDIHPSVHTLCSGYIQYCFNFLFEIR